MPATGQMSLFARDPFNCPHDTGKRFGSRLVCDYSGREVWVDCRKSVAGDPPACSWDEPDNSPEAKARRVRWMQEHCDIP